VLDTEIRGSRNGSLFPFRRFVIAHGGVDRRLRVLTAAGLKKTDSDQTKLDVPPTIRKRRTVTLNPDMETDETASGLLPCTC
jgi:hypothetical protein